MLKKLLTLVVLAASTSVFADTQGIVGVSGGTPENDLAWRLGGKFQNDTGATISINKIGRYVVTGNSNVHTLYIYDAACGLLRTTTVNLSGATPGTFVYGTLPSPVSVANGNQFSIFSSETIGGDFWLNQASVVPTVGISVITIGSFHDGNCAFSETGPNLLHGAVSFTIAAAGGGTGNAAAPTDFHWHVIDFGDPGNGTMQCVGSWSYSTNDQTGWNVEVSSNGINFGQSFTVPGSASGSDQFFVPWTSNRWWRVSVITASGTSTNYSNTNHVVGCFPPDKLTGVSSATNRMTINFEAIGPGTDTNTPFGYMVRQDTNDLFNSPDLKLYFVKTNGQYVSNPHSTMTCEITNNFLAGVRYYFQVVSTNLGGVSEVWEQPSTNINLIVNGPPDPPLFYAEFTTAVSNEAKVQFVDNSLNETNFFYRWTTNGGAAWTTNTTTYTGTADPYAVLQENMVGGQAYTNELYSIGPSGVSVPSTWVYVPPAPAGACNHYYVSTNGPSVGNHTGTNWSNAVDLGSIPWSALNASGGDIVEIGGGTYTNFLVVYNGGSTTNHVLIKASTEVGHNGKVFINGLIACFATNVTISGFNGASYAAQPIDAMTNAINIVVTARGGANFECMQLPVTVNFTADCIEVTGEGNLLSGDTPAAIDISPSAGPTNAVLSRIWAHDNWGSSLSHSVIAGYSGWDMLVVSNVVFERAHNNFIAESGSITIKDSVLRDAVTPGVAHPDGIQGGMDFLKIENCIIGNSGGSIFYPNLNGVTLVHNFEIVNNFWYNDKTNADSTGCDIQIVPDVGVSDVVISNGIIANNTFYGRKSMSFAWVNNSIPNRHLKAITFVNNLFLSGDQASSAAAQFSSGGFSVIASDLFVTNVIAGPSKKILWDGVLYDNAEAMSAATAMTNTSTSPLLLGVNALKMMPLGIDTALFNKGADLAGLTNAYPALMTDMLGTKRPQSSGWDVGPYELNTNNLLVWLVAENDFTGTNWVVDASGHGHDLLRFGRPASKTNYPTLVTSYDGSSAMEFHYYTNDIQNGQPQYFTGDYGAITNISDIKLTNATFCGWYNFYQDSSADAVPTIFGGGHLDDGNFRLGRDGFNALMFTVATNGSQVTDYKFLNFNDTNAVNQWHHFAVTYSGDTNKIAIAYYDGVAIATNTTPTIDHLVIGGLYLGVGCWTFNEDPWIFPVADGGNDNHPNNGWISGALDDLRVYDKALSSSEIQTVFSGGAQNSVASSNSNTNGGGGPTPTNTFTITINTSNALSGITVTATLDNNGNGPGATIFTRTYNESATVSFTAPFTSTSRNFSSWRKDGVLATTSTTLTMTVDANHTITAVYVNVGKTVGDRSPFRKR